MNVKVVELLLAKGANKEHRNISDYTPLSQAASGGYVNVIKVLLAHGAEINSRYVLISTQLVMFDTGEIGKSIDISYHYCNSVCHSVHKCFQWTFDLRILADC